MILKQIFGQNAHWQVNKDFARKYGINAAILVADLVDKWIYFGCPEWFFNKSEDIEENTTLSYHKQVQAIEILKNEGFIDTKLSGVPATTHFKIFEIQFLNFFKTRSEKISEQELENFENINKNKEIKIKPSLKENIKEKEIQKNGTEKEKENVEKKEQSQGYNKSDLKAMKLGVRKILKKEMDDFDHVCDTIDMSIVEIINTFSEYWVIGKSRPYNKNNKAGLVASFRAWVALTDADDVKVAQNQSQIGKSSVFECLLSEINKIGKFVPTSSDRVKLNKFIEDNPDFDNEMAIEGAYRFRNGSGMTCDVFISVIGGMLAEKRLDKKISERY